MVTARDILLRMIRELGRMPSYKEFAEETGYCYRSFYNAKERITPTELAVLINEEVR